MFTGIVEEKGRIVSVKRGPKSAVLSVQAMEIFQDMKIGDSIAVNGVCLTVTDFDSGVFRADVMRETLERSTLSQLKGGSQVNLERAMRADGRFGGHLVSGHIDGTGTIVNIKREDNAVWYVILANPGLMKYIIEKGSIAIDGISLTVAKVEGETFSVSIIPHTVERTILKEKTVGESVNLENDMVGKYIEKFLTASLGDKRAKGGITMETLGKFGF